MKLFKKTQKYSVLYANGIHEGGGKTLLLLLLTAIKSNPNILIMLDERMKNSIEGLGCVNVKFIPPGIIGRLQSDLYLLINNQHISVILSLNSLPFIFAPREKVELFFQNVNHLEINTKTMRTALKKYYFYLFRNRVRKYYVQTKTVSDLLKLRTNKPIEIQTLLNPSFIKKQRDTKKYKKHLKKSANFIYVAGGAEHKNHLNLVKAWSFLKEEYPDFDSKLFFTLPRHAGSKWEKISAEFDLKSLNIHNIGEKNPEEMADIYMNFEVLIYPSSHESCGLPLIEASYFGCKIICSEMDFARDVCVPCQTFNPHSHVSIACAVSRYMGYDKPTHIQPVAPEDFLEKIFHL